MDKPKEITYAFIDSQNLNLSVQGDIENKAGKKIYEGWKLDFKRFFIYLKDKYKVNKAYLFIGYVEGNEWLYRLLEDAGYVMIYKPTVVYKNGDKKGNVDAELVLHAMIEMPNYDKAIIVSGDGDFACLIQYLEEQDKLAKILVPNRFSFSSLLNKHRKYMAFVSDLRKKLELKRKKRE